MTRYVSHNSGFGQKFRVSEMHKEGQSSWWAENLDCPSMMFHLPKSEYHLCDPPAPPRTRWIDVGHECTVADEKIVIHGGRVVFAVVEQTHYRVRLVGPGHLMIEHEESIL